MLDVLSDIIMGFIGLLLIALFFTIMYLHIEMSQEQWKSKPRDTTNCTIKIKEQDSNKPEYKLFAPSIKLEDLNKENIE